ncbi:polysaccharide biosynthesis protein (plasmid) [Gemmatirosa kalamazoonensis]|jgi:O-antigen/teichoic acid export membrane protein|uniref:Polysaccharide biosynthesis protein n=1 Tax=Gemmatirosa kalamazoonensis TaxID=861299 RepID=W0RVE3_9BACT|nr:oligosaccharide flippase family protein [Gemmatirosa kalamazoonensis]AHG93553.1 polysaccharide biosynthesis protein [Gemmatirosa kalamazoonensis]
MNQLQRDLTANLAGRFWSMALNLLAVPVYLRYLGAEAYGLIGLLILLENISSLLDSGLGLTLNRELARRGAVTGAGAVDTRRDVLLTLQAVHWGLALVCGGLVLAAAPLIAHHWVQARALDPATITRCLRWMSLSVTAAVLFSFYQGGLFGIGRQVALNALMIVFSTVRIGGAMLVLARVTSAPHVFFALQGLALAAQVVVGAWLLWTSLPAIGRRSRFERGVIREVWRFTATVSANSFLTAAVSQVDKVIFSRVLSLADFGYYTLAGTAAGTLWSVVLPLGAPFFPRFAELWEQRAIGRLAEMYHRASQLITLAAAPLAVVLCAFAYPLLLIWTRSADTAGRAAPILTVLAIGTAMNALSSVPSHVQNACGWPGLMTTYNAVYVALLVPAIWFTASRYGAVGAAATWAVPNAGYMFVTTPIMHRRLLRGELGRWLRADVGVPLLVALGVGAALRLAMPPLDRLSALVYIAAAGTVVMATTFVCLRELRPIVSREVATMWRRWATAA